MQNQQDLVNRLTKLEEETKLMEPQGTKLEDLTSEIVDYAHEYLNTIDVKKAYDGAIANGQNLLANPFKEEGRELSQLLNIIHTDVDTPGINPASGNHLGYIPGGGIYPSALGDYLAAVVNKYSGIFYAGPGAVQLENMVIRWIAKILEFPANSMGNLTSGGSIANLIAIVTARDAKGITSEKIRKSCIYLTKQAHHSVHKAIRIAGLGESHLREIDVDDRFRMDVLQLREHIEADQNKGLLPFLVIGSAGTTDTGAVDPLNDMARICEDNNIWFHIDAAYGGFFMLVEDQKQKLAGIDRADSITIDPHKGLFLAYGLGAVIVKDIETLKKSHYYQANYMQDATEILDEPSPADLSPELTKHFRGLRMWLPLQLFGINVFRKALEEKILLCQYFYQKISDLGFEVGPEPELSVCIYRFTEGVKDANDFNQQLIKAVQDDGRIYISSTTIEGVFWLRIAVLVFRTHLQTIEDLLAILEEKRDNLLLVKPEL
jgi:glutamate/tyrosine decarboxylase-like PLP-dependent enzyme